MSELVFSRMPAAGPITTLFGEVLDTGNGPYRHRGVDIGALEGTPVYAPAAGRSVPFTNDGSFGHHSVCLDHEGTGLVSLYAHMSRSDVTLGQWVADGQQIGLSGHEGFRPDGSSIGYAPHLHWQPCVNTTFPTDISYSRDPLSFLITEDSPMTPTEKAEFAAVKQSLANAQQTIAALVALTIGNGSVPGFPTDPLQRLFAMAGPPNDLNLYLYVNELNTVLGNHIKAHP